MALDRSLAKFKCVEVTKREGWGEFPFLYAAKFSAVGGDTEENKKFFAASPSGLIEMSTIRSDHFEVGESYFVEFTRAE